jgi:hypothetical protein
MADQSTSEKIITANPNQIVYDQVHTVDHLIDVIDIFFAEKEKKYKTEKKTDNYTVKKGETIATITKAYTKKERSNIVVTSSTGKPPKLGEVVAMAWDETVEDGFVWNRINKTKLEKDIFIVAQCTGDNGKLEIELHENLLKNKELVYANPNIFLIADVEKTKITFDIKKGVAEYSQEIKLRPKTDEDLKALSDKFDKRETKSAFVFIKAEVTGATDEIRFPEKEHEFRNKDNERLEIRLCDCGKRYRYDIKRVKYGKSGYGPLYNGSMTLENYSKWDEVVKNNQATEDEKKILIAMSENEGNLDAVQGYDSEIITAGAMQKTVNPQGFGELPIQFWQFKNAFPEKYNCYLEGCKWEVVENKIEKKDKAGNIIDTTYTYQVKYDGETGSKLKTTIKDGSLDAKKKQIFIPVEPIVNLMKDPDYQAIQIKDFIKRLNSAIAKKPKNHTAYTISDFVKSNLGKATVLDQDVNRPGHVANCFGDALDTFFAANSKVSKDPTKWGTDAAKHESAILEIYGPLRSQGNYTMTDGADRFTKLKAKL